MADSLIPDGFRNGRVLDIGCGNYPYFLSTVKFVDKYGVDQHVNEGHKNIPDDISLQKFNIENSKTIPFKDGYFDVVTMLAVCEHINPILLPDRIREVYRILKPGGKCIITTPGAWTFFILNGMTNLRLISRIEIEEHKCLYSRFQISKMLDKCGFWQEKIKSGYFELFMNTWITAEK
ncbi:MAG: class I SAM-dependent methyltransferase [Candidatus Omnitrophica bacterium]|nr:class I SAM-dependent methyltransferase [Candidatus Omnitrophota bacterium]